MADSDFSELRRLMVDLGRIPATARKETDVVLKKGAQNVKEKMAADAAASAHFKQIAPTIGYDEVDVLAYEVGPDHGKDRGKIANIAYFGDHQGGGGSLDIDAPLTEEEPRLMAALGALPRRWL